MEIYCLLSITQLLHPKFYAVKKLLLSLSIMIASFAQNTSWSTSGNIGIASPVSAFQVYGSNATLWV
jgi:hypothetical protein